MTDQIVAKPFLMESRTLAIYHTWPFAILIRVILHRNQNGQQELAEGFIFIDSPADINIIPPLVKAELLSSVPSFTRKFMYGIHQQKPTLAIVIPTYHIVVVDVIPTADHARDRNRDHKCTAGSLPVFFVIIEFQELQGDCHKDRASRHIGHD